MQITHLPESVVAGQRLGRHIEHDDASWDYPAAQATTLRSVVHERRCPAYDQGNLGSCTGNAAAGAMMTDPSWVPGRDLTEADAVKIYERGTVRDDFPGEYPPEDTGSSGIGVARALKDLGLITSYRHAFGIDHALRALVLRPIIIGILWKTGSDTPDAEGIIRYTGTVRGGHELVAESLDLDRALLGLRQSWGATYGPLGDGRIFLPLDDFDLALRDGGDAMTLHGAG